VVLFAITMNTLILPCFVIICRGGDSTQKGLNDEPPLDSPVAATKLNLAFNQVLSS